jgi:hypothetical protein
MESLLSVVATADADLEVQEALEVQADPAVVAVVVDHNQTHPEDLQHRDLVVAELVMDLKVATALTRQFIVDLVVVVLEALVILEVKAV